MRSVNRGGSPAWRFHPTQRDYKRQEKLVSVDSLSKTTFDDGLFKDEVDLNGFLNIPLADQAALAFT
jgi:hypothetical protein